MKSLVLVALVTALAIALASCSAADISNPRLGTVTGSVTVSPCRPVERLGDPPCPSVADFTIDFVEVGGQSRSFAATTDTAGTYTIRLAPGTYEAMSRQGLTKTPIRVSVAAGHTSVLNVTFDSGIR